MKENVSVEKAIKCGKKTVHIPTYIFLFSGFLTTFSFTTNLFTEKPILKVEFIPIGFLLTIIFTVFFGNKLISKWKLWAFKSVRNVHELKSRAIQENLLYSNSSFMEKMEFKSSNDRKKWNEIKLKFEQEDILTENKKLQKEIEIYYSIRKTLSKSICYLIITFFFIFLGVENEFSLFIIIFTLGSLLLSLFKIRKLINRKPQLTINEKGIKERTNEVMKWKDLENEQIMSNANKSGLFLVYKDKINVINIKDFEITKSFLKEIIETNRIRNKNTTANTVYN